MKPAEGRHRVVIEEVQPQIEGGRYPAKRVLGDIVEVTAAIFADGHDHVGARLLYRPTNSRQPCSVPFVATTNDMWSAKFQVDQLGDWSFTIEAWIDHYDTWVHDLAKRLAAQPDPHEPTQQIGPQDISLALRIGANHVDEAAVRAAAAVANFADADAEDADSADAAQLKAFALQLRTLADQDLAHYPAATVAFAAEGLATLMAKYPDTQYASSYGKEIPLWVDRERARFSAWYELFPRSASTTPGEHGTLKDVEVKLPTIAAMGFDIVYMPPIHPIGVQYRKGPNNSVTAKPGDEGSPWAIGAKEGGHTSIHPKLGTLRDFDSLVRAAHSNNLELALDIAFQCSPDHPWVTEHPDWFLQRPDGSIQYAENPPKKYQDIYPLNFESRDWRALWMGLHGVFKFWIDRGVRVFRVDNPHTKALPFWEWCITEIHKSTPEAIFLAEAFTRPHVMYSLAKAGYSQSYTYFTWRTQKAELEEYFTEICNPPVSDFFRPNVWPNTPDILHEQLQVADPAARLAVFQQRVILAATLSANYGIYGPAYEYMEWQPAVPSAGRKGSEEYLDSEKYEVRYRDPAHTESIAPLIMQLNQIRRANPALHRNENLHFHRCDNPQLMAYSKATADGANIVLTVVNLDPLLEQSGMIHLAMDKLNLPWEAGFIVEDLLTGAHYNWAGETNYVALRPSLPAHIFVVRSAQPTSAAITAVVSGTSL
jgi:starch synthase (maltosyl-transferring)